ncbi:hypothetical protein Pcinc_030196 [Petrolisthes cinctipes]|uniref:Clusterin-associated protein 1 n=1 Tax=Petrolisthes cinctipes TaxID=88211 RepID=A0AAE1EZE7_PETCI|nr:hypothetical protein Pcinc_030196 [Petrolisthes cinctipes]
MSFREVRTLVEHLRLLGFPRLVSLENFTAPNLPLVTEILIWAAEVVDNDHPFSSTTPHTQEERVALIQQAALFFNERIEVQLSAVHLYGGDRLAARQLLKITSWLHHAATITESHTHHDTTLDNISTQLPVKEMREVRQLASTIIMDAAGLVDRLSLELHNKMSRMSAERQGLDLERTEAMMASTLHTQSTMHTQLQHSIQGLDNDIQEVEEKIHKKRESLVRTTKRLEALLKIKPSWHEEFEREVEELRSVWDDYITKHRSLTYLEDQLDTLHQQHLEGARKRNVSLEVPKEGVVEQKTPQPSVLEMSRLLRRLKMEEKCRNNSDMEEWPNSVLEEDSDGSFTLASPASPSTNLGRNPIHNCEINTFPNSPSSSSSSRSLASPGPLSLTCTNNDCVDLANSSTQHVINGSCGPSQPRPQAARPKMKARENRRSPRVREIKSPRASKNMGSRASKIMSSRERRGSSVNLTGRRGSSVNVAGRGRVSPLSASDDNQSDNF